MSNYVLDLLNKFRKKKVVNLSNEDKVQELSQKAVGLFDHMKKTHNDLFEINTQLEAVIKDEHDKLEAEIEAHNRKVERMGRNIDKAHDELGMNFKIQDELSKFFR